MRKIRLIPRLDVKGHNVVKGIHLEGLRVIGGPAELAKKYYDQGADELLYVDIVASLYERNNLINVIEETASAGVFIPFTVGGGIRTLADVKKLLRAGADKVAINTAATRNPHLIKEAAQMFGSQCIVGCIEAKYIDGHWEAFIDNGRQRTGLDAVAWARRLVELGAGEILIVSVDREGTQKGLDLDLFTRIRQEIAVPVVVCGGASGEEDIARCLEKTQCDGVAFASILHYNKVSIVSLKEKLNKQGINVRATRTAQEICRPMYQNKKRISVIDYGVGNIKSVVSAFQSRGNPVELVNTPDKILSAELLVLPGDGAFGHAMNELRNCGLINPIKKYAAQGGHLLGVCLGMQLLMTESEEFGKHAGLDLIKGRVVKFNDKNYRVPHTGWNNLNKKKSWDGTILQGLPENSEMYFIHSYYVDPDDKDVTLATTSYAGQDFCAVIKKDNICGTQFHPEKSGQLGMKIIDSVSNL